MKKTTGNILNMEENFSLLKCWMKQECLPSQLSLNIVFRILARVIISRDRRDINRERRSQIIPICKYHFILKRSQMFPKKLLVLINNSIKLVKDKINIENSSFSTYLKKKQESEKPHS